MTVLCCKVSEKGDLDKWQRKWNYEKSIVSYDGGPCADRFLFKSPFE